MPTKNIQRPTRRPYMDYKETNEYIKNLYMAYTYHHSSSTIITWTREDLALFFKQKQGGDLFKKTKGTSKLHSLRISNIQAYIYIYIYIHVYMYGKPSIYRPNSYTGIVLPAPLLFLRKKRYNHRSHKQIKKKGSKLVCVCVCVCRDGKPQSLTYPKFSLLLSVYVFQKFFLPQ